MKTCLVIPCYNESKRIDTAAFTRATSGRPIDLLFVDDGSTDNTYALLSACAAAHPDHVRILRLEENSGKAEAIRAGVCSAADTYDLIGFWDADLAVPLSELPGMIAHFTRHPGLRCLIASRVKLMGYDITRKWYRHYIGRAFATAASIYLNLPVYDTQCGAKLFTAAAAKTVFAQPFITSWIFDVELLMRLKRTLPGDYESYIHEYPVLHWKEVGGSKVKLQHYFIAIADFFKLIIDALTHRKKP
ncbi:MAG: glycosyltransferase family 2 protein [Spirochaetes bacterium]|nr:glycosyltransferase family 2 protein [Spirochaetota bacterium]